MKLTSEKFVDLCVDVVFQSSILNQDNEFRLLLVEGMNPRQVLEIFIAHVRVCEPPFSLFVSGNRQFLDLFLLKIIAKAKNETFFVENNLSELINTDLLNIRAFDYVEGIRLILKDDFETVTLKAFDIISSSNSTQIELEDLKKLALKHLLKFGYLSMNSLIDEINLNYELV